MKNSIKSHRIPGFHSDIYKGTNSNSSLENKIRPDDIRASVIILSNLAESKLIKNIARSFGRISAYSKSGKISVFCTMLEYSYLKRNMKDFFDSIKYFEANKQINNLKSKRPINTKREDLSSESLDNSPTNNNTNSNHKNHTTQHPTSNQSLVSFIYKKSDIQNSYTNIDEQAGKNILQDLKNKSSQINSQLNQNTKNSTNLPLATTFNHILITPKFKSSKIDGQESSYDLMVPSIDFSEKNNPYIKDGISSDINTNLNTKPTKTNRALHRIGSHKYSTDKEKERLSNVESSNSTVKEKTSNSLIKEKLDNLINSYAKDKRSNKYRRPDGSSLTQRDPKIQCLANEQNSTISSRDDLSSIEKKKNNKNESKKDYKYKKYYKDESIGNNSIPLPQASLTKRERNFSKSYFHVRNSLESDEESLRTTVRNDNLKLFIWSLTNFFKKKRKVILRRIVIHNEMKIKRKIYGSKIIFRTLKRRLIFYKLKFIHRCKILA